MAERRLCDIGCLTPRCRDRSMRSSKSISGLKRRILLLVLAGLPAIARAEPPCCGPVTMDGERLRQFLDDTGVDHLWLSGFRVDWQTGAAIEAWPAGTGAHTHCSAFAASAAMRLGVYLLRPPQHSQILLANAQMGWLRSSEAEADGWRMLSGVSAAQTEANRGKLVMAVFENPNPRKPGHIAIVRPSPIGAATLNQDGPMVTQAGGHNALAAPLAQGFGNHPGAWVPGGRGAVRFYAHDIAWTRNPARP
jgi:hypothetical protein